MKDSTYNLQVPIDLGLAETLKKLAKEDDRNLRAYCKRVLQDHVRELGEDVAKAQCVVEPVKEDKHVEQVNENVVIKQKPKVGGFRK